jgi:hypothetical protein
MLSMSVLLGISNFWIPSKTGIAFAPLACLLRQLAACFAVEVGEDVAAAFVGEIAGFHAFN